jgi:hypothetical protein
MSKELSMSEFRAIIKEEAVKLKKRMVLEAEKKALVAEMETLSSSTKEESKENAIAEGMVKEGEVPMSLEEAELHQELFGMGKKAKAEKLRARFIQLASVWKKKGAIRGMTKEMLDALMDEAAKDGYEGAPGLNKAEQLMSYRPADTIRYKGGIQGHTFGAGAEE